MKRFINLDDDITEDDELLETLIKAAREAIERETSLVFIDSTFELRLDNFHAATGYQWPDPWCSEIRLPVQPLIAVEYVQYIGNDGEYAAVPAADWLEVADEPPRIVPNPSGDLWPVVTTRPGGVLVRFRAGFASAGSPQDATNVPEDLKLAVKMFVAHWYEHREAVSTDHRNTPTEIPLGARFLTDKYRRLF